LISRKELRRFRGQLRRRVQALAKAHSLLTQAKMAGAELADIIREQVLLDSPSDGRISSSGPQLMLDPQGAVHLALVLHELATNARKYGALSVRGGRLSVTWKCARMLGVRCSCTGRRAAVPKVVAPEQARFGTVLIEQTMRGHGGECSRSLRGGTASHVRLNCLFPPRLQSKIAGSGTGGEQRGLFPSSAG